MIRVFPDRTAATPRDELAFIGDPPTLFAEALPDRSLPVAISVLHTWQRTEGFRLALEWGAAGYKKIRIGGPAFYGFDRRKFPADMADSVETDPPEEFVPGRFVAPGYVITSRGCPNACRFCRVPGGEGELRELPIADGRDVLDNNVLACSDRHVAEVFAMLRSQKYTVRFSGGLEADRVTWPIIEEFRSLRFKAKEAAFFLAYDWPDEADAKRVGGAITRLLIAGFNRRQIGCYVLIGYDGDTLEATEERLRQVWDWGALPYAMLFRDESGKTTPPWRKLAKNWIRPLIICAREEKRKR